MCAVNEAGCFQAGVGFLRLCSYSIAKFYILKQTNLLESHQICDTHFHCFFGTVVGRQLETSRMCIHPWCYSLFYSGFRLCMW